VRRVAELGALADYRALMSHRKIQPLRRDSKRWAYTISKAGLVAAVLCFIGIAALSEAHRIWPVRGFFLAFISILVGWASHYGFIVLDEVVRRHYGTAVFMSAVIAGFGWAIQSCVRGMIVYR
jgi:hypothetical protein